MSGELLQTQCEFMLITVTDGILLLVPTLHFVACDIKNMCKDCNKRKHRTACYSWHCTP